MGQGDISTRLFIGQQVIGGSTSYFQINLTSLVSAALVFLTKKFRMRKRTKKDEKKKSLFKRDLINDR